MFVEVVCGCTPRLSRNRLAFDLCMRLPISKFLVTLDSLDDDEITRLAASGTSLPGCDTIIRISDTTVVKSCDDFAL